MICMMKVCLVASSNCVIGLVLYITTGGGGVGYTFDSKNSTPLLLSSVCVSVVHSGEVRTLIWNRVIVPVPQGHLIDHLYV